MTVALPRPRHCRPRSLSDVAALLDLVTPVDLGAPTRDVTGVTLSSADGCSVPVPFVWFLYARPLAVLVASAGGAATSAGAGIASGAGGFGVAAVLPPGAVVALPAGAPLGLASAVAAA